jgi:hypothetical protein
MEAVTQRVNRQASTVRLILKMTALTGRVLAFDTSLTGWLSTSHLDVFTAR